MSPSFRLLLAAAACGAFLPASRSAQHVLYAYPGHSPGEQFGSALGAAGDVNGDGRPDFVVGAPGNSVTGTGAGAVFVHSGLDGTQLHARYGSQPAEALGSTVDGAGDVNGDGFHDWIVGPGPSSTGNYARVYSGADGNVLHEWSAHSVQDLFGTAVAGAGDIDGDGFDDVIVGARSDAALQPGTGYARVYSGATGAQTHTLGGCATASGFGISVDGAGDIDADGVLDLVVLSSQGVPGCPSGAWVHSGATGLPFYSFAASVPLTVGPHGVSAAGDVNADGYDDIVVGSAGPSTCTGSNPGSALVYLGSNGALGSDLVGDPGCTWFGWSVSEVGDVDNDGFDDVLVGAIGGKYADVRSVRYADTIYRVRGDGTEFGWACAGLGDLNLDGRLEFAVGERFGTLTVFTECGGGSSHYGGACAGTGHVPPRLWTTGCMEPGGNVQFTINKGLGGAPAFLALGSTQAAIPLAFTCKLHITPILAFIPLGILPGLGPAEGKLTHVLGVPSTAAGLTLTAQAFVLDPAVHHHYTATNGALIQIQ
jgi:FG-GAP repeat/FG-GAP-like repeat